MFFNSFCYKDDNICFYFTILIVGFKLNKNSIQTLSNF